MEIHEALLSHKNNGANVKSRENEILAPRIKVNEMEKLNYLFFIFLGNINVVDTLWLHWSGKKREINGIYYKIVLVWKIQIQMYTWE